MDGSSPDFSDDSGLPVCHAVFWFSTFSAIPVAGCLDSTYKIKICGGELQIRESLWFSYRRLFEGVSVE